MVTGLDGKEYKFNPAFQSHRVYRENKSSFHIKARELLKQTYKHEVILEEITLPGSNTDRRKSLLYVDFYIPRLGTGIEIHGQQHYEFSQFFHKDKREFLLAKKRDRDKKEWFEMNDPKLIILPYMELDKWEKLLLTS